MRTKNPLSVFCFRRLIDQLYSDAIIGRAIAQGETLTFCLWKSGFERDRSATLMMPQRDFQ